MAHQASPCTAHVLPVNSATACAYQANTRNLDTAERRLAHHTCLLAAHCRESLVTAYCKRRCDGIGLLLLVMHSAFLPRATSCLRFDESASSVGICPCNSTGLVDTIRFSVMRVWVYVCIYAYMYVCVGMYVCMYACVYVYMYMYIYVCVCVCVYVYIYIYGQYFYECIRTHGYVCRRKKYRTPRDRLKRIHL